MTWFQAAMYFSMHLLKQACSPLDREGPGLGTHFVKHSSFKFCSVGQQTTMSCLHSLARAIVVDTMGDGRTSTSWRTLVSC